MTGSWRTTTRPPSQGKHRLRAVRLVGEEQAKAVVASITYRVRDVFGTIHPAAGPLALGPKLADPERHADGSPGSHVLPGTAPLTLDGRFPASSRSRPTRGRS